MKTESKIGLTPQERLELIRQGLMKLPVQPRGLTREEQRRLNEASKRAWARRYGSPAP